MLKIEESEMYQQIQHQLISHIFRLRDRQKLDFHTIAMRLGITEKEAQELYTTALNSQS